MGFLIASFHVADDTLESGIERRLSAIAAGVFDWDLLTVCAEENQVDFSLGKIGYRCLEVDLIVVRNRLGHLPVVSLSLSCGIRPLHCHHCAICQRKRAIRNNPFGIDFKLAAQALAFRAGSMWRVEGKGARLDLCQSGAVFGTSQILRIGNVGLLIQVRHRNRAFSPLKRGFHRIGQPAAERVIGIGRNDQAVDDRFDRVVFVAVELNIVLDLDHLAINSCSYKAGAPQLIHYRQVGPLTLTDQWGQHQQPGPLLEAFDGFHNFLCRLLDYFPAADRTMRISDACKKQSKVVVNLRYGADC